MNPECVKFTNTTDNPGFYGELKVETSPGHGVPYCQFSGSKVIDVQVTDELGNPIPGTFNANEQMFKPSDPSRTVDLVLIVKITQQTQSPGKIGDVHAVCSMHDLVGAPSPPPSGDVYSSEVLKFGRRLTQKVSAFLSLLRRYHR